MNNVIYVDFNSKKKLITSTHNSILKKIFYRIVNFFGPTKTVGKGKSKTRKIL